MPDKLDGLDLERVDIDTYKKYLIAQVEHIAKNHELMNQSMSILAKYVPLPILSDFISFLNIYLYQNNHIGVAQSIYLQRFGKEAYQEFMDYVKGNYEGSLQTSTEAHDWIQKMMDEKRGDDDVARA